MWKLVFSDYFLIFSQSFSPSCDVFYIEISIWINGTVKLFILFSHKFDQNLLGGICIY